MLLDFIKFLLLFRLHPNFHYINALDVTQSIDLRLATAVVELFQEIKEERDYNTLLTENCLDIESQTNFLRELGGIKFIGSRKDELYWRGNYNHEILIFYCLQEDAESLSYMQEIERIAEKTKAMRHVRIVTVVMELSEAYSDLEDRLQGYLDRFVEMKLLNVLIILKDFPFTHLLYDYPQYPSRHIRRRHSVPGCIYYDNKVMNLLGHPLYTLPDQNEPRSFLYIDEQGNQRMSGFVGKLMQAYAAKINATLTFPHPVKIGDSIYIVSIENITRSGLIDIGTGLGASAMFIAPLEFSDFLELTPWCPMVPLPDSMEIAEMLLYMFRSRLTLYIMLLAIALSVLLTLFEHQWRHAILGRDFAWIDLIFNDKSFRGVLAQGFPTQPVNNFRISSILTMIFVTGLVFSAIYNAHLQAFLTEPPKHAPILTFDDFLTSNVKILISLPEYNTGLLPLVTTEFVERYKSIFHIIPTFNEFMERRKTLNNSFAYPVTKSLWPVFEEVQSVFQRKVFRIIPETMYFHSMFLMALPINENSIYKTSLNNFMHQVHQSGLLYHWRTLTFFDMVRTKRISKKDFTQKRKSQESMTLRDFYWIWLIYFIGHLIGLCTFAFEFMLNFSMRRHREISNWAAINQQSS